MILTCSHQSAEVCCHSMAHNLCSQAHFHGALCCGVEVGVRQLVQLVKQSGFVELIQFQYVFPLKNNRKLVAQMLTLQLHIIFQGIGSGCTSGGGEDHILLQFLSYELSRVVSFW
jgi:hypothetical protein